MSACVRSMCGADLPDAAVYCHQCGAPQVAPCPVCGFAGDDGLGFPLDVEQCPQCHSFLVHCPECQARYPLGASRCDNDAWGCTGTGLVPFTQHFACLGANPGRSYAMAEGTERRPRLHSDQFDRAWRMKLPAQGALASAVLGNGRVFSVDTSTRKVVSVPTRLDQRVAAPREAFDFADENAAVETSTALALPNDPVVSGLTVRGNHVAFLARTRPIALYDGRVEQPSEAMAFLLEASTLHPVQQTPRWRIRSAHLGDDRWLLLMDGAPAGGAGDGWYSLRTLDGGRVLAEGALDGVPLGEVAPAESDGQLYVATTRGVSRIALQDGASAPVATMPGKAVRALLASGSTVLALVSSEDVGRHELLLLPPGTANMVTAQVLNVPVDGPPLALDDTLYLLDDGAKTLRAYTVSAPNIYPSPDLNITLRELGDTQQLLVFRSSQNLYLAQKVRTQQGFTTFRVDQFKPGFQPLGFHRVRSPESSFLYAGGRIYVVDHHSSTLEALEVFER